MISDKKQERRGLGRGLSALMADVGQTGAPPASGVRPAPSLVPVEKLQPNPDQPRRDFRPDALEELAASLRQKGVIQPLIVRAVPGSDRYEIVAGERRWRAAQMAQIHDVPVVVRDFTDTEVLEIALIENVQRADLNPIEEALGLRQLMERFGHTQEKLGEALSKSRSHIANLMRLLQLPNEVQGLVRDGTLSAGHARALITAADPAGLARQVVARGLSVRETERLALSKKGPKEKGKSRPASPQKDADTLALEGDLSANLKMAVKIDHVAGGEGGVLSVRYATLEQLDMLCRALSTLPRDGDF
jgi:ParB family transcriptional regulator, chromosome partitioning protein